MSNAFAIPYQNEPVLQCNKYRCVDCGCEWADEWYCGCDDECPECGTVMTPHEETIVDRNPRFLAQS